MSEVLSQVGIDNLLTELSVDKRPFKFLRNKLSKYNKTKRPKIFSREHLRTLFVLHETFARLATASLSQDLQSLANIHVANVDQLTYDDFIRSIPNPTTMGIINMVPLKRSAVLHIDPSITFAIIDRLLGGKGKASQVNRDITDIEQFLMENIIKKLIENLDKSWAPLLYLFPELVGLESNPQFVQIAVPTEVVVVIEMEIKIGEAEGRMNLCLPYSLLEPIISRLSEKDFYSSKNKLDMPDIESGNTSEKSDSKEFDIVQPLNYSEIEQKVKKHAGNNPTQAISILEQFCQGSFIESRYTAIFIATFGKESSIPIIRNFSEKLLPSLLIDISELGHVTQYQKRKAVNSYYSMMQINLNFGIGYVRELLEGSFDSGKVNELSNQIDIILDSKPFEFIKKIDLSYLLNSIQQEHPQTIALILAYLDPARASIILGTLPSDVQSDVAERFATIDRTSPEVIRGVELVLKQKLSVYLNEDFTMVGGVENIVEILNLVDRSTEKLICCDLCQGCFKYIKFYTSMN